MLTATSRWGSYHLSADSFSVFLPCRSGLGPETPSLLTQTVNSSPRSHNVRAAGGAALGLPLLPMEEFWGGGIRSPCVCLLFLDLPSRRGGAMHVWGTPSPSSPPPVCLSAVCPRLGVLPSILNMNVRGQVPCLLPPHTPASIIPSWWPSAIPRVVWPVPPTAAAMNARINILMGPSLCSCSLGPDSRVRPRAWPLCTAFQQLSWPSASAQEDTHVRTLP